jgi:coronin-7
MWPSECNGFQVNVKRAAFMLAGSSGQIAVVDLDKPGRLPDASLPSLINKSKVADFAWDPFSVDTLACACDDGCVRIWKIPSDCGLIESSDVPSAEIKAHAERLGCLAYHPYARNVLATASYDRTIKLWNVEEANAGNPNLVKKKKTWT